MTPAHKVSNSAWHIVGTHEMLLPLHFSEYSWEMRLLWQKISLGKNIYDN